MMNTEHNSDNSEKALRIGSVRCSTCGKFMRRLKLLERLRLEGESGFKRTHICKYETITYKTGEVKHN